MHYYPDHIADDGYDDEKSCLSAEIEGGSDAIGFGAPGLVNGFRSKRAGDSSADDGDPAENDDGGDGGVTSGSGSSVERKAVSPKKLAGRPRQSLDDLREEKDALKAGANEICHTRNTSVSNVAENALKEHTRNSSVAEMIRSERNRRLGIRISDNSVSVPISGGDGLAALAVPNNPNPVGVLGNIRGWFGGGGSGGGAALSSAKQSTVPKVVAPGHSRRASAPTVNVHGTDSPHVLRSSKSSLAQRQSECIPEESTLVKNPAHNGGEDHGCDGDLSTGSSSGDASSGGDSDSSDHFSGDESEDHDGAEYLTPQERARERALRHLSGSCVDAGRRAKTASYVRGLERLDLKRKKDRFEKEMDVVESEMNKDRGLGGNSRGDLLERDEISLMASRLVRELPKIQGADAGAGSVGNVSLIFQDEYTSSLDINNTQQVPIWENTEAVNVYITSLQSRIKEALERTRSLEKRLTVLEQAGDDIVNSLCEDLAEVTAHSNKQEARYVKKGKELQRKRRREELRNRGRIKQAEMRVRALEKELLRASCSHNSQGRGRSVEDSDYSMDDSMSIVDDDDNDDDDNEVLLEKKLSSIRRKNELDKEQHNKELDLIRRQCEQLKLRLSVARLVMEGDDNLREYVTILERLDLSLKPERGSDFSIPEYPAGDASSSPPPPRVTRARARVLKVAHLELMYERRLAVSKAFTDATINALEQELSEREVASQKMEVRCLNELMMIDSGIKDSVTEAGVKLAGLQSETQELEEAVAACTAQRSLEGVHVNYFSYPSKQVSAKTLSSLDHESSIGSLLDSNDNGMEEEVFGLPIHDDLPIAKDRNDSEHSTAEAMSRDTGSSFPDGQTARETSHRDFGDSCISAVESPLSLAPEDQDNCVKASLHQHATVINGGLEMWGAPGQSLECEKPGLAQGRGGGKEEACMEVHEVEANATEVAKGCVTDSLETAAPTMTGELFCTENDCGEMSDKHPHTAGRRRPPMETIQNEREEGFLVTNDNSLYRKQLGPTQRGHLSISNTETNDVAPQIETSFDEKNEIGCENDAIDSITAENFGSNPESKATMKVAEFHANCGLPSNDYDHDNATDAQDEDEIEKIGGTKTPYGQNQAALEMLGRDLRFTLAEYQTSFDLSSSITRIQQLDRMTQLVLNIARASGLECQITSHCDPDGSREELRSWSFQSSRDARRKPSKRKNKKKKRRHNREGRHEQPVVW